MNLQKLNQFISEYKASLDQKERVDFGPHWESLGCFLKNWDVDRPDFAAMYDRCLQNTQTKRIWKREAWEPKEMMIHFAKMQPEFVRKMFKDLHDESKEISGRVSRFKFGMDAMLLEYKERNPRRIDNNHYHDDSEMIHLYLAFRYPEKYCLFDYPAFLKVNELLMVQNPPSPFETDRFFKITKVWKNFLIKEEEIIQHYNKYFRGVDLNGFLVFDFYRFIGYANK
ncbi:MAG: hypothetical protein ACI8YQ_003156 [Polaribacter sp.]|jgi:hypothetical protein